MKKDVFGLAVLFCTANSMAQSSTTLYGVVDDSFSFTNNQTGAHNYQVVNGGRGSSKWGFRTVEDLGGGLNAVAVLENGFDINTGKFGNGGRLFGRQSYVALNGPFGSIRLGRQYDLIADSLMPLASSLQFGGVLTTRAGDVDNVWGDYSVSNTIKYYTPVFAGFKFGALLSLGGVAGNFSQGRGEGLSLTYIGGPVTAAAVLLRLNNPATSLYDATATPVAGTTFTNPITNPTFSGYVSAHTLQIAGGGANVSVGNAVFGVLYTNTRFEDVVPTSSTPFSGTATFNSIEANATYRITPAVMVGAAYNYTKAESAKYSQVNLGAEYDLSKRTVLYTIAAWEHAIGTDSTGKPAVAALAFVTPSSTDNQVVVRVGIRHSF
ncbi:porin [Paraburkholderia xenovorans]|uniref:porin n=1 Tax=Paraburkholderia xenovorans TaxID=36873 RepID=UPI0015583704|nr:porin [Paraburkholderia xenovorans]NPT34254.1 porin [Paraburkholderia xenovorans]